VPFNDVPAAINQAHAKAGRTKVDAHQYAIELCFVSLHRSLK